MDMPEGVFQVRLAVEPKDHGEAALVPPGALADVKFSYVVVKEGGEEAIVKVSASSEIMKKLEQRKDCKRLTPRQTEQLRTEYPAPRIKKKYRMPSRTSDRADAEPIGKGFEMDGEGKGIVDTFQTVRSGFYLIDVPISDEG
jgi:hypothetical protein